MVEDSQVAHVAHPEGPWRAALLPRSKRSPGAICVRFTHVPTLSIGVVDLDAQTGRIKSLFWPTTTVLDDGRLATVPTELRDSPAESGAPSSRRAEARVHVP
jgi:hypothetical protein